MAHQRRFPTTPEAIYDFLARQEHKFARLSDRELKRRLIKASQDSDAQIEEQLLLSEWERRTFSSNKRGV